jgi:membrane fusion protein, multidrug efflux system
MRLRLVIRIAVLGTACSLLSGCNRSSGSAKSGGAQKDQRPLTVKATPVSKREINRSVETVGSFLPFEEVNVSSEVEGRIDRILVDVGDRVQKGQVLLAIAPEEFQYQLDEKVSALRQTLARLGVDDEGSALKSETAVPEVQKAAAELQQAKLDYERARELSRQALIPKQRLDDAEAKFNSARAGYEATLQQVRVTEAAVSQYQADVDLARKKLRDTQIKAPFSGWIKERLVSPGQYLKVQTTVYSVIDISRLKFRGDIPEKMAPWVHPGGSVDLEVEAYPDRTFSGKISRVTPASSEQSRSFTIEAILDNQNGLLKAGFFAKALVVTDRQDTILSVPSSALVYDYGVYKVFVIHGNRIGAKEVKIGDRVGDEYEIVQGIGEGDLVATTDLPKLNDGMHVVAEVQKP